MKYYIPELEDIFVGYECEVKWHSSTNGTEWRHFVYERGMGLPLSNRGVRTAYLTREQLSEEGWKPEDDEAFLLLSKDTDEGESIHIVMSVTEIHIFQTLENMEGHIKRLTLFLGERKSINEFRKICRMLGI